MPPTLGELRVRGSQVAVRGDIAEVSIANVGEGVVQEHRVYPFREVGTACFVYAASVGPCPVKSMFFRYEEEIANLYGYEVTWFGRHVGSGWLGGRHGRM